MEAGLNASLELQCRKTMEIRTKHVRAGFAAGLEGLKAMEIGAKQYDKDVLRSKKGPLLCHIVLLQFP